MTTRWALADPCHPDGRALADRHYSRRTPGSPRFVPPGRSVVLVRPGAVWVTYRPDMVDHQWWPSWTNSLFRREPECDALASDLIREAIAVTRHQCGLPPAPWGLVTFVDAGAVRAKRDPGRCYLRAGFEPVGWTAGGHGRPSLRVLVLRPDAWPEPMAPFEAQSLMFGAAS